jgi:hypothetical protein
MSGWATWGVQQLLLMSLVLALVQQLLLGLALVLLLVLLLLSKLHRLAETVPR